MMKISAAQIGSVTLAVLLTVPALAAPSGDQATASAGVSRVRIVRLSEVKGDVQMDRGTGRGYEAAIANLPIVENCRLQTGNGVAEVEFEDNSSLRLAPDSEVEFPKLDRLASGATVSSVRVLKGMAYVSLMKTAGNQFNLLFGQQNLALPAASHVRLQVKGMVAWLAVLGGDVQIQGPSGVEEVPHKRTITFALNENSEPTVAKSIEPNDLDKWDSEADQYHARRAAVSGFSNTGYAYGSSDLAYYGAFSDVGGCGMMWRPYFTSAAWNPYSNGAWAYYGNAGYSWVSPYPWGWIPYHSGAWSFCPGAGWGWSPGGSWMGLNNGAGMAALKGPILTPRAPVRPPRAGEPGLLLVNERPLVRSEVGSPNSFVFRRDSAGLGVPRDQLGRLNKFSQQAISRGSASTSVYMQAPMAGRENGRPAFTGMTTMRRGSAPPAVMSRGEMNGGPMRSGQMNGGQMRGGEMNGGPMRGGPMRGGERGGYSGSASRAPEPQSPRPSASPGANAPGPTGHR